jgi:hypothetical protein
LQRDVGDRQADRVETDHFDRPELLQEQQLQPVEEDRIDDELRRQHDGGRRQMLHRNAAPVARCHQDRDGGDEEHHLPEQVTDQHAFDAIEHRAGADADQLQHADTGGELEEIGQPPLTDEIEFDEGADRLDEEQRGRDIGDRWRRRRPMHFFRGEEEQRVEAEQHQRRAQHDGDQQRRETKPPPGVETFGFELWQGLGQRDAGAEFGNRGAGHHQPERKGDDAIGLRAEQSRRDDGGREPGHQKQHSRRPVHHRIRNNSLRHAVSALGLFGPRILVGKSFEIDCASAFAFTVLEGSGAQAAGDQHLARGFFVCGVGG